MGSVVEISVETPEILQAADAEHRELRAFLGLWNRLCAGRIMPAKGDVTPKDLRQHLRNTHIYDVVDHGADFYTRVMGSSLYAGLEQDQTGCMVSQHPRPMMRERFMFYMRHVVSARAPARSSTRVITGNMLTNRVVETLWMPIGPGHEVDQILGISIIERLEPSAEKMVK